MDFIILLLFCLFIVCVYLDSKKNTDRIKELLDEVSEKDNTIKELQTELKFYDNRELRYVNELENFKKELEMVGKQIDYIPYYKTVTTNVDKYFVDKVTDYIIPEIHIRFGESWDRELYESLNGKVDEDEGKS
nr:MAG TPA: hypothetical protein [Caudoviricetes sp.]